MVKANLNSAKLSFDLIRPQLEKIEARIREQAKTFDPGVEGYVAYVCNTSGKRIRPALAVLSGGATGSLGDDQIKLGVILELIHIATLVHDDIIDGASIRRNLATANAKWGNNITVLLGDCLFAHALTLATSFDDTNVSRKIALAANDVCQGEIVQTQRQFDLKLGVTEYLRIIEMKTASLFACAMELGALLAGASEKVQEGMKNFGLNLGTAYQIYDDCLDLVGEETVAGKTLGTDLAKGKLTLPILNLIADATETQRAKLNRMLIENEPIDISVLAGIADYEGAIEQAVVKARGLLEDARGELEFLNDNDYVQGLKQITAFVDEMLGRCVR